MLRRLTRQIIELDRLVDCVFENLLRWPLALPALDLDRLQWSALERLARAVARDLEVELAVHFLVDRLRYSVQVVAIQF